LNIQVPQCGLLPVRDDHGGERALAEQANPTDDDIDQRITNICRCGTFVRVRRAIHSLAKS
jgi:isoquinoline 1-oxidoreductase alpha subunit